MKKLILITCLLIALLGMARNVVAAPSGYGSNNAGEIHKIDLETGETTFIGNLIDEEGNPVTPRLHGLAIDPLGETLYGSDQNGNLYRIEISTGAETLLGNMGIVVPDKTEIEAMDFNFNGTELWVTDFDSNTPTIYKINNFDTTDPISVPISATPVQTVNPGIGGGVVRAMTADTTEDVWVANDSFDFTYFNAIMDFQSIDTDVSVNNVTHIGFLDDDPTLGEYTPRPKIKGMDRAADGVLYGLAEGGGIYSIDQTSGLLTLIKDTDHVWLGLAAADAAPTTPTITTPTIKIALDIKPEHCPNKLKIKGDGDRDSSDDKKGDLIVAVLGTQDFNVSTINVATLNINGIPPVKCKYKDVTAPAALEPCDCEELPKDTYEDLVLKFNSQDIIATLGIVQDGDIRELMLKGNLLEDAGGTAIEGKDCVLIEDKGDDNSSDDGSCYKKKWRKKGHYGDDDSSGHKKWKKKRHHGDDDSSGY